MFPCLAFGYEYWWIFPIMMLALMVFCFFMMKRHVGLMMCRPSFSRSGSLSENATDPPLDILDKKNSQGEEINKQEYEEKKKDIAGRTH